MFVGKHHRKRRLGITRRRWEDNINIDVKNRVEGAELFVYSTSDGWELLEHLSLYCVLKDTVRANYSLQETVQPSVENCATHICITSDLRQ